MPMNKKFKPPSSKLKRKPKPKKTGLEKFKNPEAQEIQAVEVMQRLADAFKEPEKPEIELHYIPTDEERKQETEFNKIDALFDELDLGESPAESAIPLTYQEVLGWRWVSTMGGRKFALFENPKNAKQKAIIDHHSGTVEVFMDDNKVYLNSQRGRDIVVRYGLIEESDLP